VSKNSPALKSGLKLSQTDVTIDGDQMKVGGDVIVGINDQPVKKFEDLLTYLTYHSAVGNTATLSVLRDGQPQNVTVTLTARPAPQDRAAAVELPSNNDNNGN
jgi:2-alkenal reductase